MSGFKNLLKKLTDKELAQKLADEVVHFTTEKGSHLTPEMKEVNVRETIKQLRKSGEDARLTKGNYIDEFGKEYPEPSIMVLKPKDVEKLRQLAKETGQESLLYNLGTGDARLENVLGSKAGQQSLLGKPTILTEQPKGVPYTEINTKDGKRFITYNSTPELLSKIDTPEKASALRGQDRQEYLDALTQSYGDKNTRRDAMGFSPETFYHGTSVIPSRANEFKQFDQFEPLSRGAFFTQDPKFAENFNGMSAGGFRIGADYPVNLKSPEKAIDPSNPAVAMDMVKEMYKDSPVSKLTDMNKERSFKGLTNKQDNWLEVEKAAAQKYIKDKEFPGYRVNEDGTRNNIAVYKPEDIRSVNAAFDPRFKKSGNILAGVAAIPAGFTNPLEALKEAYGKYEEQRGNVSDKVADMTNLVPKQYRSPEQEERYKNLTNSLIDPINMVDPTGATTSALFPAYDALKKRLGSK